MSPCPRRGQAHARRCSPPGVPSVSRLVEGKVQLEHVHTRLAEEPERAPVGVLVDQPLNVGKRQMADGRDTACLQLSVGGRDVGIDTGAGGRYGVDGDLMDRQPRVIWGFQFQNRLRALAHRLRERGVGGTEIRKSGAGAVVGGCAARRPLVEELRLRERLGDQPRADHRSVNGDQAAVSLMGERELGETGEERRQPEPEHDRDHDHGDDRRLEVAQHQCVSPSTIGPSVKAGKTISPAVSTITPTSRTAKVAPSVRKVPAETGALFLAASEPPIASAASDIVGTKSAPTAAYLISRASIFLPRYSGVRPTIKPATKTAMMM